ncbi:hypothetical protein ACEPPN_005234 [Leptodophora sp. 'Broadleaf-Isolate-01']
MVSTRTQDGTISTKTYSPLTLDLNALSLRSPPSTPTRTTRPGTPTKVLKPRSPRKGSLRIPRTPISARKQKFANIAASEANAGMLTSPSTSGPPHTPVTRSAAKAKARVTFAEAEVQPREQVFDHGVDLLEGNMFFPSVIIGAKETVGLSKIGRADKEVEMWEGILAEHREHMPSLVPVVEEKLWEAKHKRACMDETLAENVMIGDVNPAESIIRSRIEVLEWALSTSKFGPEAENIKCAIAGYMSGEIGYNDHFTVIYAAHIVDTVATYSEFVHNRTEMLDRYFDMHGPGWMWYEPPLNVHPETNPKLCPSVDLKREDSWSALGGWYVLQGFWKRSGYVERMAQTTLTLPAENQAQFETDPNNPNLVNCQGDGPRLSFRSLLDSGATFPSLHIEDFANLQIDMDFYSAQSATVCETAAGARKTRLFELLVCVLDHEGKQLVNQDNAVYPLSHKYLGGLCPVSLSLIPQVLDANGILTSNRLSGLLPLVASYVTSTPTLNTLYLGEDRNSVLGAHRMPGQRKWSIDAPPSTAKLPRERYGEPKIRFSHRKGRLVDQDDMEKEHVSYLVVRDEDWDGSGNGNAGTVVHVSDPGKWQREADEKLRSAVSGLVDVMRDRGIVYPGGFGSGGAGG